MKATTREEKLKYCRYYKGEDENPYKDQNKRMFWLCESIWVRQNDAFIKDVCDSYKEEGGKSFDGVQDGLIATIFNSWAKSAFDISKEIKTYFYPLIENEYL